MFDCWENGGKFDREPVILRTVTSVILDDVLATCLFLKIFQVFNLNLCIFIQSTHTLLV